MIKKNNEEIKNITRTCYYIYSPTKYAIGNPESLTTILPFFDHFFHTLFSGKKHKQPIEKEDEEEATPPQESSVPPPYPSDA